MRKLSQKKAAHGHIRRTENRAFARNYYLDLANTICHEHYIWFCRKFDFNAKQDEVSEPKVIKLYHAINKAFEQRIPHKFLPVALFKRSLYFQAINRERKKAGLTPLPSPAVAYQPKRLNNTAGFDQFQYLVTAQKIHKQSIITWQNKSKFTTLDTLTWLLYSLIMYGGVNDATILKKVYEKINQNNAIVSLSKEMLFIPIDIESTKYANQAIKIDNSEDIQLSYSRWIFIDDISRLWLAYLLNTIQNQDKVIFPKYHQCIRRLSEFVDEKFSVKNFEKSDFLKYIPIFWQTLPNCRLDEQSTQLLIGNQAHTALTTEQWQAYQQPLKNTSVCLSLSDFESLQIGSSHAPSQNKSNLIQTKATDYRSDFVKDIHKILNGRSADIIDALLSLRQQTNQINQLVLIQWMIDLKSHNKPSTLKRYLTEVGNAFLAHSRQSDLLAWDVPQYEYMYQVIVAEKNLLKMDYTKTVLHSLHKTLIKHFKAPIVIIEREQDPQMVKSILISVATYHDLLESIKRQKRIEQYYIDMLMLITILLYRAGFRISELLGIRLSDVEHDTTYSQFNIIVRANAHRSLKSDDATRRVCLNALLKPNELSLFQAFFKAKQQHKTNRYLFTLQGQQQPISRHSVEQPIKKLLGKKFSHVSLHSFRHNAISNMTVILKCPPNVVSVFTDYNAEEAKTIKHHFLGSQRTVSANYWDALMEFAGHADLNTTFASYVHTADVVCACQLAQAQLTLPVGLVMKLTNKEKRSFNQHQPQALKNELVSLPLIRKLINPLLHPKIVLPVHKPLTRHQKQALDKNNQQIIEQGASIFGKYDPERIHSLLTMLESGKSLDDSHSLGFEYADALAIYERALQVAKLNKLIYGKKKAKSAHILIAPTLPKTEKEKGLVRAAIRNIEHLFQTKKGKQDIEKMLALFVKKVNKSHTDLRFTFKEKEVFYQFLDIVVQVIPEKHWQVNISVNHRQAVNNRRRGDKKHAFVVDALTQERTMNEFKANYPKLANKLTSNRLYNGYALRLLSPLKVANEYRASNVFRYVCHLLLVVEGDISKI